MAFGGQQEAATAVAGREHWELRQCKFLEAQDKQTKAGKPYWRIRDERGWYSVWDSAIYASIEIAANAGETIPCAVQIKPGNNGGSPFYTIAGVNAAAAGIVEEGKIKAAASYAPGGRNSEFGKRMHPDESLRVMLMNSSTKAVDMAIATLDDRPSDVTRDQWIYAKVPEYMNFINQLIKMPITPTPQEAPAPEAPEPSGFHKS